MPLPLTVSCFSEIQINFTFLVPAHLGSPGKRAVKRVCRVCVCVCNILTSSLANQTKPETDITQDALTNNQPSDVLPAPEVFQISIFPTTSASFILQE